MLGDQTVTVTGTRTERLNRRLSIKWHQTDFMYDDTFGLQFNRNARSKLP